MRFLLFALHAARGPAPPRTVLKATTNHYELNQELSRARAPDELLQVVEARAPDFNAVNAATALQRLATAKLRRGERARGAAAAAARAPSPRSPRTTRRGPTRGPWRRRAGRSRSSA